MKKYALMQICGMTISVILLFILSFTDTLSIQGALILTASAIIAGIVGTYGFIKLYRNGYVTTLFGELIER